MQAELKMGGLTLSYCRIGAAHKTIVFIHGNSACKDVFDKQFAHLAAAGGYSALAFDLPGHGASSDAIAPEVTYTIPAYATQLRQAMASLSVGEHVIVGWSLGGNIALELAGRDLEAENPAFKGAMIFGAPPVGPGSEGAMEAYLPAAFESAIQEAEPTAEQLDAYIRAIYGRLDPVPDAFRKCALRTDGRARQIMVQHWLSGAEGCNQMRTATSWKKPLCVLHGVQDAFVPLDYLNNTAWRNLWRGKVVELADCGHAPFLEDAEAFNEVMEAFVRDVL